MVKASSPHVYILSISYTIAASISYSNVPRWLFIPFSCDYTYHFLAFCDTPRYMLLLLLVSFRNFFLMFPICNISEPFKSEDFRSSKSYDLSLACASVNYFSIHGMSWENSELISVCNYLVALNDSSVVWFSLFCSKKLDLSSILALELHS